jgi:hypothetical protein
LGVRVPPSALKPKKPSQLLGLLHLSLKLGGSHFE